jgi:hypothetical protein
MLFARRAHRCDSRTMSPQRERTGTGGIGLIALAPWASFPLGILPKVLQGSFRNSPALISVTTERAQMLWRIANER